jgi:hypothetical protein
MLIFLCSLQWIVHYMVCSLYRDSTVYKYVYLLPMVRTTNLFYFWHGVVTLIIYHKTIHMDMLQTR